MKHFGVARMTVRQAIQQLRSEGLVSAQHGRGVFVNEGASELGRVLTLNHVSSHLIRAVRALGDFQVYINDLPEDQRATPHELLGRVLDPVEQTLEVLGEDSIGHRERARSRQPDDPDSEWPAVKTCAETVEITAQERRSIDSTPGGEYPARLWGRCNLAAGHAGPHYDPVQNVGDGHETWLVWDDTHSLREFRREPDCPLELPLSRDDLSPTSPCMLFDGHPGPHHVGNALWWWGGQARG